MDLKRPAPFEHLDWRPGQPELRRFAVSMLVGFALLGLLAAWRHHHVGVTSFVLWGIGAGLAAAALVPGLGRAAYLAVYVPTSLMGFVVSRILLTGIYFLVFTPLGLLLRAFGKDLLALRRGGGGWSAHREPGGPEGYYRQS